MVPRALIGGLVGALLLAVPADAVPAGSTLLVDRPSGFGALPFDGAGRSRINTHAISENGCFVVFESTGDDLVTTDDNAAQSVYRVDRCTAGNPIVQVNTTSAGVPSEAGSAAFDPSISSDGRRVAFQSGSHVLDAGATTLGRSQIFVKDLQTGALEIASRGNGVNGATIADNVISRGLISGDGNHVAFATQGVIDADNVDGVAGQNDLYVRDLPAHTTHMASITTGGAAGHGVDVFSFDLDSTASRVVFTTANKLAPAADADTGFDVYARHAIGGGSEATQLVSFSGVSQPAGADKGFRVAISPNSVFVAWSTFDHVFTSQCVFASCGNAVQADMPKTGGTNAGGAGTPAFGPDTFTSRVYWLTDSHLDPADTDTLKDLYGRDIADTNANTAIHLMTAGITGEVAEADATDGGALIVMNADPSPHVLARAGAQDSVLSHPPGQAARTDESDNGTTKARSVSANGRFVAFETGAPAFGGTFNLQQIAVRDVVSGQTTLASVASDGTTAADGASFLGGIDSAGDRVVFTSNATNLVPGVGSGMSHVYVRDLASGTTRLVDRNNGGTASASGASDPGISGDGRRVAFQSSSADLPGAPFDGRSHVYLVDLAANTSVLVDQTSNGIPGDQSASSGGTLDESGRHVAFVTSADNLGGGANPSGAVYVRDIEGLTTTWVSMPEDANPAHQFPFDTTSISGDGRRVAFANSNADFGFGAVSDTEVFVRDVDAGTTVLASRGGLGPANEGVHDFSMSGDGTKVAFATFASNLDGAHGTQEVYVRDLSAGTTTLAALRDGGGGPGRLGSSRPSLNADGACLAFTSNSDDLVASGYGPDHFHAFLRALTGGCLPDDAAPPPGGGPGAPPAPPPMAGATDPKPVVSGLKMTNKRFALAKKRTAVSARAKRGTAFVFALSEPAQTTITISRAVAGRRSGKRCVKPRRSLRKRKRCTRLVKVGTLKRSKTKAGKNTIAFTGRLGKKALARGRYRASVVATDVANQRSAARQVSFTVVRGG